LQIPKNFDILLMTNCKIEQFKKGGYNMSISKFMAERFALDLNGVALGMWEASRLFDNIETQDEGRDLVERLRQRLKNFKQRPFLSDSLRLYSKTEFVSSDYESILDRIGKSDLQTLLPEIKGLVVTTRECIDENRRERSNIKNPL